MSNPHILQEAADWIVALRAVPERPATRESFALWLRRSPEHVQAYLELTATWADLGQLGQREQFDARALIERAKTRGNVIPLDAGESHDVAATAPSKSTRRKYFVDNGLGLITASVAALLVAIGGAFWYSHRYPTYSAGIGEQRAITLADGSIVELNSRSRVRVRYSPTQRTVELLEGQGLFRVAHNSARPFIVQSGDVRVRAVGTQFDVYRKRGGTVVTVVEGRVEVTDLATASEHHDVINESHATGSASPSPQPATAVQLAAGEQVTVTQAGTQTPSSANVAIATAWTQHQLVFESAPLADVAQEFNRYNERQLVVANELQGMLISGVFSSADSASLLRFLRDQVELEVQETDAEVRIVPRAP